MVQQINIHGTAILIDGFGILFRGASGAGKSLLALELMASNKQAILVADDRIDIIKNHNQIIMQAPNSIAGLIELYGHGIISKQYINSAKLDLVVDFIDSNKRMPEQNDFSTSIEGIEFLRCPIPMREQTSPSHQILLIEAALAKLQENR